MAQTKQIRTPDKTIVNYINIDGRNILHNCDGPALIPQGNRRLAEYHIFGFQYTKEDWEDRKRDVNGVPFHKKDGTRV